MSYVYSGEKVRVPAEVVGPVLAAARKWLRHQLHQPRAGYVYVTLGKLNQPSASSHRMELIDSKQVAPGMFAVPVVTLWAEGSADFQPLPLLVATGELPDLGAEVWCELWNSGAEDVEGRGSKVETEVIVGGDPAAMELDPDAPEDGGQKTESKAFVRCKQEGEWINQMLSKKRAQKLDWDSFGLTDENREWFIELLRDLAAEEPYKEHFRIVFRHAEGLDYGWWIYPASDVQPTSFVAPVIDPASACVVAPCAELLEVSGEFGPRKLAEAEGRACAEELLRVGSPEDVRKRAIAPCPYPLGSSARVWWCWGLNQVVKAAEEAALGVALVERWKNS